MSFTEIIINSLTDSINAFFVGLIVSLALLDVITKKDLKSQIVSIGVLGTFVGIFIGLQAFDPADMKNSINHILVGLKTAFFTSIVGMSVASLLAIIQKIFNKKIDDENYEERLLAEISDKLNSLTKLDWLSNLDNSSNTDKIIGELERLRSIQTDTRDETTKISLSIKELKENSNKDFKYKFQ